MGDFSGVIEVISKKERGRMGRSWRGVGSFKRQYESMCRGGMW